MGSRAVRMPKDQRRVQLLDAANDVFTTRGYHASAMDDIAEAAGVSKPVLYQHFSSKLDLYLALLDRSCERLVEVVSDSLASTQDNAERVTAAIGAFYDFVSSARGEFRFVFESDLTGDTAVQQRLWQVNDEIADAITDVIATDTALPRSQAKLLAISMVGHGPGQRPLVGLAGQSGDTAGRRQAAGQRPGLARNPRRSADRTSEPRPAVSDEENRRPAS